MIVIVAAAAAAFAVGMWRLAKSEAKQGKKSLSPLLAACIGGVAPVLAWAVSAWLFWVLVALAGLAAWSRRIEQQPASRGKTQGNSVAQEIAALRRMGSGSPGSDADDHSPPQGTGTFIGSEQVAFRYRTADGATSDREITVSYAWADHFKGFCHERGATRTFRYDRIRGQVTMIETGELLSVRQWQRALGVR